MSTSNLSCACARIRVSTSLSVSSTSVPSLFSTFWPIFRFVSSTSGRMYGTVSTLSMYFSGSVIRVPSSRWAIGYTRVTIPLTSPVHRTVFMFTPYAISYAASSASFGIM